MPRSFEQLVGDRSSPTKRPRPRAVHRSFQSRIHPLRPTELDSRPRRSSGWSLPRRRRNRRVSAGSLIRRTHQAHFPPLPRRRNRANLLEATLRRGRSRPGRGSARMPVLQVWNRPPGVLEAELRGTLALTASASSGSSAPFAVRSRSLRSNWPAISGRPRSTKPSRIS